MREVVLDTETTGLEPLNGDRVVEIGCVELLNHVATGRVFHQYLNPERSMPTAAFEVHGLSDQFLSDKPLFADVADQFLEFLDNASLVIHNAAFDLGFLNAELGRLGRQSLPEAQTVDTLGIARRKFPGAQNSLDGLCRRFGVDNSGRTKHGALLDAELLSEVYIELIGGRQAQFSLVNNGSGATGRGRTARAKPRPEPLPQRISAAELEDHRRFVESLGDEPAWTKVAS